MFMHEYEQLNPFYEISVQIQKRLKMEWNVTNISHLVSKD